MQLGMNAVQTAVRQESRKVSAGREWEQVKGYISGSHLVNHQMHRQGQFRDAESNPSAATGAGSSPHRQPPTEEYGPAVDSSWRMSNPE